MERFNQNTTSNDEWLTPPEIIRAFPEFDLDPCSPINRPWSTAKAHFTKEDNGLNKDWFGSVWMNPPYGRETGKWLAKLADHGDGIALIFARTETKMFFERVWNKASAILFIKGRLSFYHVTGERAKSSGGAPSVLIAYGNKAKNKLKNCRINGQFIELKDSQNDN